MIKIQFLGTGSMVPTKKRNHSSILITYKGERMLMDCGEGTQRQIRFIKEKPSKITKILISHWHGDHILGIPGLMQTMASHEPNKPLMIYGPENTKKYIKYMFKSFSTERIVKHKIKEIKNNIVCKEKDYEIHCAKLQHVIPTYGYSFIEKDVRKINKAYLKKLGINNDPILKKLQQGKNIKWKNKTIKAKDATWIQKGKKITYIPDTRYCKDIIKLAKDSDLLICESTFGPERSDEAKEYKHLTATQAAEIAKESNSKHLILTHFSQRYKDTKSLLNSAKKIFKKTECAEDFLLFVL